MTSKEQSAKLNYHLGQRVRALRENLKLTRKDMAERLGISEYFVVEIESGRKGVSNVTLCKLAEVLCTTTDYLLTGRSGYTDTTTITAMLTTIDPPLLKGAEDLLKAYLGNISYIKAQVEKSVKDED